MTPARRLLAVGAVLAAGMAVGAWVLVSGRQPARVSPSAPAALASPTPSAAGRAGPVRLRIPSIAVDALVDEVGLIP